MFQRIIVEDWTLCLPLVSFIVFFAVYVVVTLRVLRLRPAERRRLAALPLDDISNNQPP